MIKYTSIFMVGFFLFSYNQSLSASTQFDRDLEAAIKASLNNQLPDEDTQVAWAVYASTSTNLQGSLGQKQENSEDDELARAIAESLHTHEVQTQVEQDELYAMQFGVQQKSLKNDEQTSNDEAMARDLQDIENKNYKTISPQYPQHKDALNQVLDALYKVSQDIDVHAFNKSFVNAHKATILQLNDVVKSSANSNYIEIIAKLKECQKNYNWQNTNLDKALDKLQAHLAINPVDAETGLNVAHLFSQNWDLCKRLGGQKIVKISEHQSLNNIEFFLWSMAENIETHGGCFPGFAGRFLRDNVYFLSHLI